MHFDFTTLPAPARDKLLHSTIVPRPIAWISSENELRRGNLAPFSFFNVFAADPPIVGMGVNRSRFGGRKDTARNILETREFVVNLVDFASRQAMNISASEVASDVDEAELAAVEMTASLMVRPRRVLRAPVAMECRLHHTVELGVDNMLILGEVVVMYVADGMIEDVERHYVDTPKLDLIARMHGQGWYSRTDSLFQMKRINLPETGSSKSV